MITLAALTYDTARLLDTVDATSWPRWGGGGGLFRSTDQGCTFHKLHGLKDLTDEFLLRGYTGASLAAAREGKAIALAWQDHTVHKPGTEVTPVLVAVSRDGGVTFAQPQTIVASSCSCCRVDGFFVGQRAGVGFRLARLRVADVRHSRPGSGWRTRPSRSATNWWSSLLHRYYTVAASHPGTRRITALDAAQA